MKRAGGGWICWLRALIVSMLIAEHRVAWSVGGRGRAGRRRARARDRRLRVLRGIKQSDLAELAGVPNDVRAGSVPHSPTLARRHRCWSCSWHGSTAPLTAPAPPGESSPWKVHSRATHLTACSRPRWRARASGGAALEVMGRSLWRFATPQIQAAEAALAGLGWHDRLDAAVIAWTDGNGRSDYRILPGTMMWEPVVLSDGTRARLCTTLPLADLLAMAPDAVVVSRPPA
jgi:hypothetical protein